MRENCGGSGARLGCWRFSSGARAGRRAFNSASIASEQVVEQVALGRADLLAAKPVPLEDDDLVGQLFDDGLIAVGFLPMLSTVDINYAANARSWSGAS